MLNLRDNVAGIQGHSQGELFPVLSYTIGESRFASYCGFVSQDDDSRTTARAMKLAADLTALAFSQLGSGGFSVAPWDCRETGYLVSMIGGDILQRQTMVNYRGETIDVGFSVADVFRFTWDNLDWLQDGRTGERFLGGWIDSNQLYLDRSIWIPELSEAIRVGRYNRQLAIWDISNRSEIRI